MDAFHRQQQQHQQHQPGGGGFWFPSSSPPPPPGGYHPPPLHLAQLPSLHPTPPYPHLPNYASQQPIPPPQHHQQQQWFHPQQQPPPHAMAMPPSAGPLPHPSLPYHGQPGLPPPYTQPPHRYPTPPPSLHPAAPPPPPVYPSSSQAWGNPSWSQHQGWEYPDRNMHYANEEDWAAKARAWAAANSTMETHHTPSQLIPIGRMEEHEHAYHDQLPKPVHPVIDNQQPSFPHSNARTLYNREDAPVMETGQSPQKNSWPRSSIYEQEVSYSYSSSQGKEGLMDRRESSQDRLHSPFTALVQKSSMEPPHFFPGSLPAKRPLDASDQPLDFQPRSTFEPDQHKKYTFGHDDPLATTGNVDQNFNTPVHSWSSSAVAAVTFPQIPIASSAIPFDSSFASQSSLPMNPAPVFGGIPPPNLKPPISSAATPFVPNIGTSLRATTFPGDANGALNLPERPKKAAVPNWLREELIKKKSASANPGSVQPRSIEMEDVDKPFTGTSQADSKSIDSNKSTEDEEDDEDEVEVARSAAINLEIKRVLTEVLLKVTDELFDEIATKVMNEDETSAEVESKSLGNHRVTPPAIPSPKASAKILISLSTDSNKADASIQNSSPRSPGGNILGLANYDSDASDGDGDDPSQGSTLLSSIKLAIPSHHEKATAKSSENTMKGTNMSKTVMNADANCDMEEISLPGSIEKKRDGKSNEKAPVVSETLEKKISNNSETGGEVQRNGSKGLQSSDQGRRRHESASGERTVTEECLAMGAQILSGVDPKPTKRKDDGDIVKEIGADLHRNDDNNYNNEGDKPKEKTYKMDKLNDPVDSKHVKLLTNERESHPKISSMDDTSHTGRKEILKDKGEQSKDTERKSEHKREREDYKRDGKEDQSTRVGRESFKHNGRSKSPSNRGRNAKDSTISGRGSATSDDSADNSRIKKMQSHRVSLSPSPTRSRKRQMSRSPHSKHSHRRHSPYSSSDRRRRRSRSISPVQRRRTSNRNS